MEYPLTLIAVALLGFTTGLFLFKIKSRWCRICGSTLRCPRCTSQRITPPQPPSPLGCRINILGTAIGGTPPSQPLTRAAP